MFPLIPITWKGERKWVTESQLLELWPGAECVDGVIYLPGEFTKLPDNFEVVPPRLREDDNGS